MREILPGVWHWSTFHEPIGRPVSSYYVEPAHAVIDPKVPDEGLDALPGRPELVVLTIGLHHRDAAVFAETFGIPIRSSHEADERLGGRLVVQPFHDGEALAPGISAIRIGQIAPDEYALHVSAGEGALSFADGLVNYDGLRFVPDSLLGEDPEAVKRGLRACFRELLSREFDHLLFAHGEPMIGGGKAALRAFAEAEAEG
ncbi:MAG TPA: hypothetical protein VE992_03410 [Solirubrobacteraceae bacterium]|nr:hypothetical protein [Solirubrobacteraceae bacterium]